LAAFDEQRKHERLRLRTDVLVSGEGFSRFKTHTIDFSEGGLFIEGKVLSTLKPDTIIQVQLAEGPENPPLLDARIAWTNSYGAGIEYLLDGD
jgi:hypothetical protein